jgi:hypothetical protein
MLKLALNESELELIRTLIARDERRVQRLTGKQRQSKAATVVIELNEKLKGQVYNHEFEGNRNEFRALETVLYNFRLHLETQSLPGYDRRIQMHPEAAAKYGPYIEREEAQLEVVKALLTKVEKELKKK